MIFMERQRLMVKLIVKALYFKMPMIVEKCIFTELFEWLFKNKNKILVDIVELCTLV